jgi:molecular chaperone GrpE
MVRVKVKGMEDQEKREEKTEMDPEKTGKLGEQSVEEDHEKGRRKKTKKVDEMTKQELIVKLSETEEEAHNNYDLYMRTYAEMENIKKRGIKEREELAKYANESLIKELLPVIDSLEKAIAHARDDQNSLALVEGLELTRDGLMKTLEKAGLEEVEAMGKPFNPNFHEAVSQQKDDAVAPGHVMIELQKGYVLNGRLIRPSTVVISSGKDTNEERFV